MIVTGRDQLARRKGQRKANFCCARAQVTGWCGGQGRPGKAAPLSCSAGTGQVARRDPEIAATGRQQCGHRPAVFASGRSGHRARQLPIGDRGELTALCAVGAGLAATGVRAGLGGDASAMWVVRADQQGTVVWERWLGADGEQCRDPAIVAFAEGSVVVAGDAVSNGSRCLRVARLDPFGAIVWQKSFGPDDDNRAAGSLKPPMVES